MMKENDFPSSLSFTVFTYSCWYVLIDKPPTADEDYISPAMLHTFFRDSLTVDKDFQIGLMKSSVGIPRTIPDISTRRLNYYLREFFPPIYRV